MARKVSKKRSKKRATRSTKKRATKSKTKRRAAPAKAVTQEERQLAVYHNPFSRATKQPKIPDGKMTESLGFQTQAVGELSARNTNSPAAVLGDGTMHILLFGGQNCGMAVFGDLAGSYPNLDPGGTEFSNQSNRIRAVEFITSNRIIANAVNNAGGTLQFSDQYALWRLVSQGCRLSLLNPAEEDDGWWEAVRITEPLNLDDWALLSTNNRNDKGFMTVAPREFLQQRLPIKELSNQNSYSTGLLRDLKNHVFALHPVKDLHDFRDQESNMTMNDVDIDLETIGAAGLALGLEGSVHDAIRLYDQWIDGSMDMIYIRIHGRVAGNPTRLHYNIVSNQEVVYGIDSRDSRYHTTCGRVGNIGDHVGALGQNNAASTLIPP